MAIGAKRGLFRTVKSLAGFAVAALLFTALPCQPSSGQPADYRDYPAEQLIDELAQIDKPAPGLAGRGIYEAFIAEDKQPRFAGGVLGAPAPDVPPQMRELVRRGVAVLPLLIQHLGDDRPTRIVVGEDGVRFFFMYRFYDPEYDPRIRPYPGFVIGEKHFGDLEYLKSYAAKVGDVCYVLVGQIVNRDLMAVRHLIALAGRGTGHVGATPGLVVSSPLQAPQLISKVKTDWTNLDAAGHEASLLNDIRTEDDAYRLAPAFRRLRYYYPGRYAQLEGEDLAKRQGFEADDKDYRQQAQAYSKQKEYIKAAGEWTKWIETAPNSPEGYRGRAEILKKAGQPAEAIEDFNRALELEKRPLFQALILQARAHVHESQGSTDLAISDLKEAVRRNPEVEWIRKKLGRFLNSIGEHKLAIETYDQAIQIGMNLYAERAVAYRQMGNMDKAMQDFDEALGQLRGDLVYAHEQRARTLMTAGRLDEAMADITKAAEVSPNSLSIMGTRAQILLAMGKTEDAVAAFDAALRGEPVYLVSYCGQGLAFEKLGQVERAVEDYHRCLEMSAEDKDDRDAQEIARARLKILAAPTDAH